MGTSKFNKQTICTCAAGLSIFMGMVLMALMPVIYYPNGAVRYEMVRQIWLGIWVLFGLCIATASIAAFLGRNDPEEEG